MPNFMSDEELGLSNGDLLQCDHCRKVYSVDDWHTCPEGAEASRKSAEAFNKRFVGGGKKVTREFIVTITTYDTETAFEEAWSSMAAWRSVKSEDTDDVLGYSWSVEEVK